MILTHKEIAFKIITNNEAVKGAAEKIWDDLIEISFEKTLKYKKNVVTLCFDLDMTPATKHNISFFYKCIEQTNQLKGAYKKDGIYYLVVGVNRGFGEVWQMMNEKNENHNKIAHLSGFNKKRGNKEINYKINER